MGLDLDIALLPTWAKQQLKARRNKARLFDHLVGAGG
jgi:hypothetical protein